MTNSKRGLFTKYMVKERIKDLRRQGEMLEAGFNLALFIAANALILAKDKSGADYGRHLTRVASYHTDSETKMIIGLLHDLVEDTDWTLDDLREVGFSERVIAGVDGMTHRPGEPYFDFIVRGGLNPDTRDVKLHDLHDNTDQSRNNFALGEKDRERINKYIFSYRYLVAIKEDKIKPGTPFGAWMAQQPPQLQDFEMLRKNSGDKPFNAAAAPAPLIP